MAWYWWPVCLVLVLGAVWAWGTVFGDLREEYERSLRDDDADHP
jgi:hypothetical protein